MPATPAWLAPLESLLNRNLALRGAAGPLLRRLDGRSLQLDLQGLTQVRAAVAHGRVALLGGDPAAADATIGGTPLALLGMMRGHGAAGGGTGGSVQVRGDAEVAAQFRELFALARPDPEEEAARVIGDVAAHRLGNLARGTLAWLRHAHDSAAANVAEYLTEEGRDVVNRTELEEFLHGVDQLREAVDRAEARVARLAQRRSGGG